jgi:protein-tyrosine phosphatase
MTKIRDKIFLGHEYDAHMDQVAGHSITASLNVANDLNDPLYPIHKLITVKVGLSDDLKNSPAMIELAVSTLKHLVDQGHTVLIHCRAGMSRSPHILALYLSQKENKTYREIWEQIRSLRHEVLDKSKLVRSDLDRAGSPW